MEQDAKPRSAAAQEEEDGLENSLEERQQPRQQEEDCGEHQDGTPEEGWFAWVQVLGAFCLNLNTWGLMNAFGVYQTFYELKLLASSSPSAISWIGSTQAFLMFIVSMAVGPVVDAGYLRTLMALGSLLTLLGVMMTSLCHEYWQVFLAQAVTMGLGFGCLYVPAPTIVSQYFHRNTALAMGASSAGSAIGGIIYPIIFTRLEPQIGFRWTTRVIGLIILTTQLVPLVLMKAKSAPAKELRFSLVDRTAFKDTPYILLNVGLIFGFTGLYIIFYYIQLYALHEASISKTLESYLLVIINASSLPGRLIPGFYADRIGSINVQTIVAFISAVLTFCLLAIKNSAGLIVFCIIYGFSAGAFMGLPAAGVVRLSADKSKVGTRLGMTLAVVGCGVLVGNPIAGAILKGPGGWAGLIGWCGALLTVSVVGMASSRVSKVGFGLKSKI